MDRKRTFDCCSLFFVNHRWYIGCWVFPTRSSSGRNRLRPFRYSIERFFDYSLENERCCLWEATSKNGKLRQAILINITTFRYKNNFFALIVFKLLGAYGRTTISSMPCMTPSPDSVNEDMIQFRYRVSALESFPTRP